MFKRRSGRFIKAAIGSIGIINKSPMEGVKQNYRPRSRLEVFYSGGCVRLSKDGTTLACACADEVKVRIWEANKK